MTAAVLARQISTPETWAALGALAGDVGQQVRAHGEMNSISAGAVPNVRTVRSIALAWVLTLPAALLLSGALYWLLRQLV